jgi:hypothetical protein
MFGWLKNLFGSEPVQEPMVLPPLPKTEKVTKKVTSKAKVSKTAKKVKRESVPVESVPVESAPVDTSTVNVPKKKGGRPKKTS